MFMANVPALLRTATEPVPVNAETAANPPDDNAPSVAEVRLVAADARNVLAARAP